MRQESGIKMRNEMRWHSLIMSWNTYITAITKVEVKREKNKKEKKTEIFRNENSVKRMRHT